MPDDWLLMMLSRPTINIWKGFLHCMGPTNFPAFYDGRGTLLSLLCPRDQYRSVRPVVRNELLCRLQMSP